MMTGNLPATAWPLRAGRYTSVARCTPSRKATRMLLSRATSNGVDAVSALRARAAPKMPQARRSAEKLRRLNRSSMGGRKKPEGFAGEAPRLTLVRGRLLGGGLRRKLPDRG